MKTRSTGENPGFGRALEDCAATCERALLQYPGAGPEAVRFRETLTEAMFAIRAVTGAASLDEEALRLGSRACQQAANLCRHHGLDIQLLDCAARCQRAAELCEHALVA